MLSASYICIPKKSLEGSFPYPIAYPMPCLKVMACPIRGIGYANSYLIEYENDSSKAFVVFWIDCI